MCGEETPDMSGVGKENNRIPTKQKNGFTRHNVVMNGEVSFLRPSDRLFESKESSVRPAATV
jgi:hypothetical protein